MVRVPIDEQVGEQGSLLIRRYRRGGFIRHFLRETYWAPWNSPLRPLAELEATETARQPWRSDWRSAWGVCRMALFRPV